MTQVDVALTDYAVAAECAAFAIWLAAVPRRSSPVRPWFVAFFASITSAAAFGGTVHGFFSNEASLGYRILWPATMIVIGLTALSGIYIGAALQFAGRRTPWLNPAAIAGFLIYCVVVIWVSNAFFVAILGYLPAVVFLGVVFAAKYRQQEERAFLIGFFGVCTTLVAAGVQQAKLDISARYFNHNALYHILQGIGLAMVFVTARHVCNTAGREMQKLATAGGG